MCVGVGDGGRRLCQYIPELCYKKVVSFVNLITFEQKNEPADSLLSVVLVKSQPTRYQ